MQPQAKLYRVVIELDPISKFAEGSTLIEKAIETLEKEKHSRCEGIIVDKGAYAFDKYPNDQPKVGQRVRFAQYSGEFIEDKESGKHYRIINDLDIFAVVS